MKINLLFVNLVVRKTFFSILLLASLTVISQTPPDSLFPYRKCLQFSPLYLLDGFTNTIAVDLEYRYTKKLYVGVGVGLIFNPLKFQTDPPTEQTGFRLCLEAKYVIGKKIRGKRKTHFFVGVEPYFKHAINKMYNKVFLTREAIKSMDSTTQRRFNSYHDSVLGPREFTAKRTHLGSIIKVGFKFISGHFNFEPEVGIRIFYKIVTYENLSNDLEFGTSNRHNPAWDYKFNRFNGWEEEPHPYINVKFGYLF